MKSYKEMVGKVAETTEVIQEADHSELARKAAAEYRKALMRGDTVAANAAQAEHVRHKKAAELLRKKSPEPGASLHEAVVTDLEDYFDNIEIKKSKAKKTAEAKKDSEEEGSDIKGSQLKFFNTFKEDVDHLSEMAYNKDSKAHQAAKKATKGWGDKKSLSAEYHDDGTATLHAKGYKFNKGFGTGGDHHITSTTVADNVLKHSGGEFNHGEKALHNHKQNIGGLGYHVKKHADDHHTIHIKGQEGTRSGMKTFKEQLEALAERNKENAIKRKMMDASRGARYKTQGNPVPDAEPEHKTPQAHNKAIGRALRKEESEQIDELSKKTLGSYIKKASVDAKFKGFQAGHIEGDAMANAKNYGDGSGAGSDIDDKAHKRLKGVAKATDRLTKESAGAFDDEGNFSAPKISYKEFMETLAERAQYVVKATHNQTGRIKVSNYVADKDESDRDVHDRASRDHKPSGYSVDSVRRKDIEAHGEGDEETSSTTPQKRGRGRPAGSKSGARGPRIK